MVVRVGDPASLTRVLDVATTLTTKAQMPMRRDRELTWYRLVRTTNEELGSRVRPEVLELIYKELWKNLATESDLSTVPALLVRKLQIDALADPGRTVPALTSAVDVLDELTSDDNPLGRDAAVRAIAGQLLQVNEGILQRASAVSREHLGEALTTAADDTTDDVRQLADAARLTLIGSLPQIPSALDGQIAVAQRAFPHFVTGVTAGLDSDTVQRMMVIEPKTYSPGRALSYAAWLPTLNHLSDFRSDPGEPDQFNVGLARADTPAVALVNRSLQPDQDYLVWAGVGPADPDALPDPMGGIDLSRMVAGDTLEVVLFDANGNSSSGTLRLGSGRPLGVGEPADDVDVPDELRRTRLYFRFHTPTEPGQSHLRVCLYHHGALLRVHHLVLSIGRQTARFKAGTPYAIATSPTTADVGRLAQRRLSIYTNSAGDGTHGFFFRGGVDQQEVSLSAVFDSLEVKDLLQMIRGGLRIAAWGSDSPPKATAYKYGRLPDGTFGSFNGLRKDLIELARSGYDAWEEISSHFANPARRRELQQLMRRPGGVVDIAPRSDSTFVPPMAGLYDFDLDTDPNVPLALCPEAEEALRLRTPLQQSSCFGPDGCDHADTEVVCPSGFWGLRHDVGVPLSDNNDDAATPRLDVGGASPRTALIGTVPDTVVAGVTNHAGDVISKLPGSVHVTDRDLWFKEAAKPATYPILYFLCHGEHRDRGGPVLVLDKLGRAAISKSNLAAKHVALDHRPLVVLNACDTAALEPDKAISLVKGFTYNGAGAVIGTETAIFPSLAYAFAKTFLDGALTPGTSLGSALRTARLELLRLGNPLGLAYILYGLPDAHLN
ncbi:CHAT domain-containing protein [Kribbella sp. NBC_00662]|uniref:CHAT domain-containing protein n=1 Tax=Kribbella sp. NBC_00662 TaxID=2975969 RepID=UPI003255AD6F